MAIKEVITLEGVEQVEAGLKRVSTAGEQAVDSFRKLGKDTGQGPFDRLVDGAKKAGLHIDDFSGKTNKLREAFRILHPVLNAAGVQIGNLGIFARLASGSLAGLAIAAGGTLAVAMGRLEESTAQIKTRLNALTGSQKLGAEAFKELEAQARRQHTTIAQLLPAYESLRRGLERANQAGRGGKFIGDFIPQVGDVKSVVSALGVFDNILQASGLSAEDARKASDEFFAALAQGGKITSEMLQKLPKGAVDQLAQAFGKGANQAASFEAEADKLNLTIGKTKDALVAFQPEAQKAFDTAATKTMKGALQDILNTIDETRRKFTETTGISFSAVIIAELEDVNRKLRDQIALIETWASALAAAYERVRSTFAVPIVPNIEAGGASGFTAPGGAPFARGGMVRGPGSTTSDSILAFLSNREFVVNARAVSHYGADLFAALNAMRLPRDFAGRFNMGGLVRAMAGNHFAAGGMVTAGATPIILNIDRQSFAMSAGDDTVKRLKRFAVSSQLSSTGRKPRWVR